MSAAKELVITRMFDAGWNESLDKLAETLK